MFDGSYTIDGNPGAGDEAASRLHLQTGQRPRMGRQLLCQCSCNCGDIVLDRLMGQIGFVVGSAPTASRAKNLRPPVELLLQAANQLAHHIQSGQDLFGRVKMRSLVEVQPGHAQFIALAERHCVDTFIGVHPEFAVVLTRLAELMCVDGVAGPYPQPESGGRNAGLGQLGDARQLRQVVDDKRAGLDESGLQIRLTLVHAVQKDLGGRDTGGAGDVHLTDAGAVQKQAVSGHKTGHGQVERCFAGIGDAGGAGIVAIESISIGLYGVVDGVLIIDIERCTPFGGQLVQVTAANVERGGATIVGTQRNGVGEE